MGVCWEHGVCSHFHQALINGNLLLLRQIDIQAVQTRTSWDVRPCQKDTQVWKQSERVQEYRNAFLVFCDANTLLLHPVKMQVLTKQRSFFFFFFLMELRVIYLSLFLNYNSYCTLCHIHAFTKCQKPPLLSSNTIVVPPTFIQIHPLLYHTHFLGVHQYVRSLIFITISYGGLILVPS